MKKDAGLRTKEMGETHDRRTTSQSVAVLALQGDFDAHRRTLAEIGVDSFEARRPEQLPDARGLILPGGESTTMWKFFESSGWEEAIRRFAAAGKPILGTCAGAILLASDVTNPSQKGLGLLDIAVERNAYGRQLDSFIGHVEAPRLGGDLPAVFIRAPRIRRVGPRVETLATLDGEPVLVRSGNVVAATFHPELTGDRRVHEMAFGACRLERQVG
ncbi:MAG TPA: pyridoxal 5'-phosphate synthase glutaminase subunit PdxT [Thermoanaerobaculia bacterium]